MDPAELMRHPCICPATGGDQTTVLVGDDQSYPGHAAFAQCAEEPALEHLVLGVADIDAKDLGIGTGISKSEVSRVCCGRAGLEEQVKAFRNRVP